MHGIYLIPVMQQLQTAGLNLADFAFEFINTNKNLCWGN